MRILVLDDEQTFLLGIKSFLEDYGMRVDTAETFDDALSLLEVNAYEAAIVDIRLTGVLREEGLDILEFIKKCRRYMKVIIITGYGNSYVKQRAYALGADAYFEKPVSAEILLNELKR
jgi:ActR/RegA family two-component response regulator